MAEPKYLSIEEYSLHCGLSIPTIRRRVRDGSIPSMQPGGARHKILIPIDALKSPDTPAPGPSVSVPPTASSKRLVGTDTPLAQRCVASRFCSQRHKPQTSKREHSAGETLRFLPRSETPCHDPEKTNSINVLTSNGFLPCETESGGLMDVATPSMPAATRSPAKIAKKPSRNSHSWI